ncbi:hypothetical protein MKW92_047972 [Papaver armeniacum]|nr:hypothetical protein MKW92_047972 [Papaver armeniacum]
MPGGGIEPANKVRDTFLRVFKEKDHKMKRVCDTQKYIRAALCNEAMSILKEFEENCATPIGKLRQVADAMTAEMHAGLAASESGGSQLKMLNSYVDNLTAGDERGLFYALDLGGTNFLVLRVQLGGRDGRVVKQEFTEVSIPPELMTSATSSELFDFIAKELARFIATEGEGFFLLSSWKSEGIGFYFFIPCYVVLELTKALDRQGIDMRVAALALDQDSLNVGEQIFEKIISGMYLGDSVRRVLCKMAEEAGFFGDIVPPKLKTPFTLRTPEMSAMHHDTSADLRVVESKLKDVFGISDTSLKTRRVVVNLCNIVATRGAHGKRHGEGGGETEDCYSCGWRII